MRESALGRMEGPEKWGRGCLAEWEAWERGLGVLCVGETLDPDTGPARSGCLLSFPGVKSKWHLRGRRRDSRRPRQLSAWRLGQHTLESPLPYSPWTACFTSPRLSRLLCAMGHC